MFFHCIPGGTPLMFTGILSTAASAIAWWRDCIIESDMGMHTEVRSCPEATEEWDKESDV